MSSNVINNHSNDFLGSKLCEKMYWFVSVCCLHQKLGLFLHHISIFRFFGLDAMKHKKKAFGTLFQLGNHQILKIDTPRSKKNQVAKKNPGGARGPPFPSGLQLSSWQMYICKNKYYLWKN